MSRVKIVLVEDHALVRAGLRALLDGLEGVEVVAEAANGQEALALIATHRPHLALMDISMPGLNGLEVAARVAKDFPGTRVLMLSMHTNEDYVVQALRVGASGYLLKGSGRTDLEVAVRAVARGDIYLSPAISRHVVTEYIQRRPGEPGPTDRLTSRQKEILQLVAEGHTTKDIARRLKLSIKTVETHRGELMDRLGIHDVPGLVRYAIRSGLISAET